MSVKKNRIKRLNNAANNQSGWVNKLVGKQGAGSGFIVVALYGEYE